MLVVAKVGKVSGGLRFCSNIPTEMFFWVFFLVRVTEVVGTSVGSVFLKRVKSLCSWPDMATYMF